MKKNSKLTAAAAVFATALTAASPTLADKPMNAAFSDYDNTNTEQIDDRTTTRKAGDYSEQFPGVGIAILKGQKEDQSITGEQIGQVIVNALGKESVPAQAFVAPGGDYTAVSFVINGFAYGPYGLDQIFDTLPEIVTLYEGSILNRNRDEFASLSMNMK